MSRAVWKYGPLEPDEPVTLAMPDARIVAFGEVHGHEDSPLGTMRFARLFAWAEVDPAATKTDRKLVVVGTGWQVIEPGWVHHGTVVSTTGYVWHLYENPS